MSPFAALAALAKSPGSNPTGTGLAVKAQSVSDWFKNNGHVIVRDVVTVIGIFISALIIRKVTLTFIHRAVDKAAMRAETKPGRFLEAGLLMGAERDRKSVV